MEQQEAGISYEIRRGAALITLDRQEALNAVTLSMLDQLRSFVLRAEADPSVTGIVFTGAGRAFCAGLDASALMETAGGTGPIPSPKRAGDVADLPTLFSYLPRVSKPVIAAVNGVAAGAGFVLAMMSDLRFASAEASFTTVFSKRGLIAEHATSWMLPRLVGVGHALDLLWSSRKVPAEEALRIGLVERVVPGAELVEAAVEYLVQLAATVSPRAIAVMKAQVYTDLSETLPAAAWRAAGLAQEALGHPDAMEGVRSFVERRAPSFARWPEGNSD